MKLEIKVERLVLSLVFCVIIIISAVAIAMSTMLGMMISTVAFLPIALRAVLVFYNCWLFWSLADMLMCQDKNGRYRGA